MKITIPTENNRKDKPLMIVDSFDKGSVSLIDEARLSSDMAKESINLIQTQDGLWSQRPGRNYYGVEIAGETTIDGAEEYVKDDTHREIIAVGGTTGKIFKSTDGASWTELSGATLTPGLKPYFKQINSIMFITNGTDDMVQYNGTALNTYAGLSTPSNVQLSRNSLTAGDYTMFYQITALNEVGETTASTEASIAVNKIRDTWATGESIGITWDAVSGATRYQIYWSDESGYESYIDSVTNNAYTDDATMQQNPYVVVPNDDTTTAPKFRQMELSSNRIWGTGDVSNPYRVHFSGVGQFIAYFSEWYGGGWVDLEKGGRETPISVVHYRNGSGASAATILCKSPEGEGTIWQITLESVTVGDVSFTVPIPVKVVGSIGTVAPNGVVKVGNDIMFPNKQGIFTLSNAPQLLNVLATKEKSQLIRPSYRGMNQAKVQDICGIYHDAKVLYSCAIGTENDTTFVFDYERRNWNWKWTFGAKQWLKATDANGRTHLLYVPPTGNRLVEVSDAFNSDFGQPIRTSYISGLLPFTKDDTSFAKVKECVFTLGRLKGTVQLEVLGVDAKRGFTSVGSSSLSDTTSALMFVESIFGKYRFSNRVGKPKTFSQANKKKRVRVGRKINRIQVQVYSNTTGAEWTLLNWQAKGTIKPTSLPSAWK